ncbi:DUF4349 domain-containing protein [Blastococcus brunescens]|uniref:DUF4349 domain-containing protein n=1 Tax=Blastococcus brunescens TaxID=1564165 RepID=A0ABZ1B4T6_9ACTN|nr:DUF4349 domain-containing protein [Blastococcus sp. BMG 8361]WRL65814.1 DUF4349 domain-containing protein [Blastococcus sp. BMG 8361]
MGTAAAALAVALLVGCTGPGAESGSADRGASGGGAPAPIPGDPQAVPDDADSDRQVITTASAVLAVEEPIESAQQVSELVESAGGRVDERTEQARQNGAEGAVADLVVRVPAEELTGVLADLADLGDVESVSVSGSDVTDTAVDLDARISALQTSVTRLQALMDAAASTEALLAAEAALSERQAELESLQSRRASLADQVELSRLHVHLKPFGVAPVGGPDGFGDGLGTGWRALVAVLSGAVMVVGVLLPWVAAGGLLAAAVLVPIRLARRRSAGEVAAPPEA